MARSTRRGRGTERPGFRRFDYGGQHFVLPPRKDGGRDVGAPWQRGVEQASARYSTHDNSPIGWVLREAALHRTRQDRLRELARSVDGVVRGFDAMGSAIRHLQDRMEKASQQKDWESWKTYIERIAQQYADQWSFTAMDGNGEATQSVDVALEVTSLTDFAAHFGMSRKEGEGDTEFMERVVNVCLSDPRENARMDWSMVPGVCVVYADGFGPRPRPTYKPPATWEHEQLLVRYHSGKDIEQAEQAAESMTGWFNFEPLLVPKQEVVVGIEAAWEMIDFLNDSGDRPIEIAWVDRAVAQYHESSDCWTAIPGFHIPQEYRA